MRKCRIVGKKEPKNNFTPIQFVECLPTWSPISFFLIPFLCKCCRQIQHLLCTVHTRIVTLPHHTVHEAGTVNTSISQQISIVLVTHFVSLYSVFIYRPTGREGKQTVGTGYGFDGVSNHIDILDIGNKSN